MEVAGVGGIDGIDANCGTFFKTNPPLFEVPPKFMTPAPP
jgi:hypothetical protein